MSLEDERRASLERQAERRHRALIDLRAREVRRSEGEGTWAERATSLYSSLLSPERIAAIAERAAEMDHEPGGRRVNESELGFIETETVMDVAVAYVKENPRATNHEVWEHVNRHGKPRLGEASFKRAYMAQIRRDAGVEPPSGNRHASKASRMIRTIQQAETPEEVRQAIVSMHGAGLSDVDAAAVKEVAEERLAEIEQEARTGRRPERPASKRQPLGGKAMVEAGARIFQAHPEWTGRQVYEELERNYELGMAVTSWLAGKATEARRLSITMSGPAPDWDPEIEEEPVVDSSTSEEPEPDVADEPEPQVFPALIANGSDPDRILLELGGQRLHATRDGSGWAIEFEGTVDADVMHRLMSRVMEGVAG